MNKVKTVVRGGVWVADLNPGYGVEIHKRRPALIISNDVVNRNWPRIIILPFSSQVNPPSQGKVLVKKGVVGIAKDSVILTFDIRSIDRSRLIKKIGTISEEKMLEVEDALKLVLGMTTLD